jgi:hypothetical protein
MLRLSILICSVQTRDEQRAELLRALKNLIGPHKHLHIDFKDFYTDRWVGAEVEVVMLTDHKQMSVGAKRNLLIEFAKGEYISFVDDDDMVMADYVPAIVAASRENTDVIVYEAMRYENGQPDRRVIYDKNFGRDYSTQQFHYRLPNHITCTKREIAARVKFPVISFGEDSEWAKRLLPHIKTQHRIYEVLYEYWFDSSLTETQ